jgi:hypothetical protein
MLSSFFGAATAIWRCLKKKGKKGVGVEYVIFSPNFYSKYYSHANQQFPLYHYGQIISL